MNHLAHRKLNASVAINSEAGLLDNNFVRARLKSSLTKHSAIIRRGSPDLICVYIAQPNSGIWNHCIGGVRDYAFQGCGDFGRLAKCDLPWREEHKIHDDLANILTHHTA